MGIDLDDEDEDDDDEEEEEEGVEKGGKTKKKKRKKVLTTLAGRHRSQFDEALKILSVEIKAYHHSRGGNKEAPIPRMRINKFVRIFKRMRFITSSLTMC